MAERGSSEFQQECKKLERLIRQEEKTQREVSQQVARYEKRLVDIRRCFCGSTPREVHRMAEMVTEALSQKLRTKAALEQEYNTKNVLKKTSIWLDKGPGISEEMRREEVERVLCKLYKSESILIKRIEKARFDQQ